MGNLYTTINAPEKNNCMVQAIYLAMIMPNGWQGVDQQMYKQCNKNPELYRIKILNN